MMQRSLSVSVVLALAVTGHAFALPTVRSAYRTNFHASIARLIVACSESWTANL